MCRSKVHGAVYKTLCVRAIVREEESDIYFFLFFFSFSFFFRFRFPFHFCYFLSRLIFSPYFHLHVLI